MVCAFDVIEHVEDDSKAIDEMIRVCKSNGAICCTVPAFKQLWSEHDVVNHHYRRYTMNSLLKLIKHKNGSIIYKTYFNSILFSPILLFRICSKMFPSFIKRKGAGSDFTVVNETSIVNRLLSIIFFMEYYLLKFIKFPFGVSILLTWRKN